MRRPCFIVVDHEHFASISSRKLVIETAKFNVITAYSGEEAAETLARFPAVDGIVVSANVQDVPLPELISRIKRLSSSLPTILVGYPTLPGCEQADYCIDSFDPTKLLNLLKSLNAEKAAELQRHEEELQDND